MSVPPKKAASIVQTVSLRGRPPFRDWLDDGDLSFRSRRGEGSVHKFDYGHKFAGAASASVVAGRTEAGDCCRLAGAGFIGLGGGAALRRECKPGFAWRKRYRDEADAAAGVRLMSVTVRPDRTHEPAPVAASELIEIELVGGCRVRVGHGVKASALRLVLDVLERR